MALVSLILLALKKVTVKTAVPVAPFVVLGFILCIIAGM
jgi:prepilin signal peptidase PulO-like enzyme (type II secretory pathway)